MEFKRADTRLRTAFFWIITQPVVVIPYRRFGICCSETSVRNYHYSLRNDPEERSSQLLRGGSMKSWIGGLVDHRACQVILETGQIFVTCSGFEPWVSQPVAPLLHQLPCFIIAVYTRARSAPRIAASSSDAWCRVQLKCDGTRWRTGGEVKGKLANGVGSQYPLHHLGTWCTQHYYRWCAHLGPRRFKWSRPILRKTKFSFCACATTFQTQPTSQYWTRQQILLSMA
jgi:hypothetical protein